MHKTSDGMRASLGCPICGAERSYVTDVRHYQKHRTRRRRQCENGHRFTSYELTQSGLNELIAAESKKKDVRLETIRKIILG